MFVLYYYWQSYDAHDLEVIATSESRHLLERRKTELTNKYATHMKKYNEWVAHRRDALTAFLFRQKKALLIGSINHFGHKFNDADELIIWLVENCPWTDWAWAKHYFDVSLVAGEPLLVLEPYPHCNDRLYVSEPGHNNGEGLMIAEVKHIKEEPEW